MRLLRTLLVIAALLVLALLVYQIPFVQYNLGWRLDIAQAYVKGVLNPVEAVPTPLGGMDTPFPLSTPIPTMTPSLPAPTELPTATTQPSPTPLPASVLLPAPEWEKQDWNNCGPATMTMYLRYYGWEGDQFDISDELKPERADRNVNVEELYYYVSNNAGWLTMVYRVGGDIPLLKTLLANGIPVMIEAGEILDVDAWPDDDRWAGHYLLINGYDDASQEFITQDSYRGADSRFSYEEIDQHWQAFNRVFIVVYHPNQDETVRAILGPQWDIDANRQHALEVAQAETEANPQNAFAWFNLGNNLVYFEQYGEAALAFDEARTIGLPQRMFRYQFTPFMAYFHSNRTDELMAIVDYALQRTDNSEEALVWKGWGLYRQGDKDGSIQAFQVSHSAYADNGGVHGRLCQRPGDGDDVLRLANGPAERREGVELRLTIIGEAILCPDLGRPSAGFHHRLSRQQPAGKWHIGDHTDAEILSGRQDLQLRDPVEEVVLRLL